MGTIEAEMLIQLLAVGELKRLKIAESSFVPSRFYKQYLERN